MQIVVRVLNLAIGAVVTALVARSLGRHGYGQWSTMFVALSLVAQLANLGVETIAVREAARSPELEREWIGGALRLRLLSLAPLVAASIAAVLVIKQSDQMLLAGLVLVASIPFSGFGPLQRAFELRVNNRVPMLILTLRSVLWGTGVLSVYLLNAGMVALAVAMSLTNAVCALVGTWAAMRITAWPGLPRKRMRALLKAALPVGVSGLLVLAYGRIDQVIVFGVIGSGAAGSYGSAYSLVEQAQFIPISILTTLAPVLAASWPVDRSRMLRTMRLTAELMAVASFGGLAFTLVGSRQVIQLVFGAEFLGGAPVLPVLVGAFILMCFGYLTDNVLVTLGLQTRMMLASLFALIVNVAGNLALVPPLGALGAAWMTVLTELVVLLVSVAMIMRRLELSMQMPGRLGRTVISAALLWGVLAMLHQADGSLLVLVIATCVAYPLLLLLLRAVTMQDIRVVMGRGRLA